MEISPYSELKCCDSTRNVDSMLLQFNEDKLKILSLIITNPKLLSEQLWNLSSTLCIDRSCQQQMGIGNSDPRVRKYFSCPQCKNIGRINSKYTDTFTIECGKLSGKRITIDKISVPIARVVYDKNILYSDTFTNYVMNSWLWEYLLSTLGEGKTVKSKSIPTYPRIINAFICGDNGYLLREKHLDINSLLEKEIDIPKAISSIISQLVITYHYLRQFGDIQIQTLEYIHQPISFNYNHIHISGPVNIVVYPKMNSSIKIGNTTIKPINTYSKGETVSRQFYKIIFTLLQNIKIREQFPEEFWYILLTEEEAEIYKANNTWENLTIKDNIIDLFMDYFAEMKKKL